MRGTLARWASLGFIIGGSWALSGGGCVREVDDHCANLSGDASCIGYFGKSGTPRNFCSSCEAAFHGCVDAPPEPDECWAKGPEPSEPPEGTGTTDGPDPGTGTGASSTGGDETPTGTGDGTDTGGSSTGEPQPVCGNGVIEGDETCDGEDLGGQDCRMFGGGGGGSGDSGSSSGSGGSGDSGSSGGDAPMLSCNDDCTLDPSQCPGFSDCGDMTQQDPEECDGPDLNGQSCATLEDERTGGNLTCANCLFNTTACCLPNTATCQDADDCCSGICTGLIGTPLVKQCKAM